MLSSENRPRRHPLVQSGILISRVDIAEPLRDALDLGTLPPERVRLWSLVLTARRIPHRLERKGGATQLLVSQSLAERARNEVLAYENENHSAPPPAPLFTPGRTAATLLVLLALLLVHVIAAQRPLGLDLAAAGSADAFDILRSGQWWRLVTALTLHADGAHLLANMAFGGLIFLTLLREFGPGSGWLLALMAGAGGNLLNTLAHGPGHDSLGASTAVFGAAGVLGACHAVRATGAGFRPVLQPLAAALMLLAFLGAEGERSDLGAHLFGFMAGLALGLPAGLLRRRYGPPPRTLDLRLGLLGLLIVTLCWFAALR